MVYLTVLSVLRFVSFSFSFLFFSKCSFEVNDFLRSSVSVLTISLTVMAASNLPSFVITTLFYSFIIFSIHPSIHQSILLNLIATTPLLFSPTSFCSARNNWSHTSTFSLLLLLFWRCLSIISIFCYSWAHHFSESVAPSLTLPFLIPTVVLS